MARGSASGAIRLPPGLAPGLFLVVSALLFLWLGRNLPAGAVTQMGPGYTPRLVCLLQLALGVGVIVLDKGDGEAPRDWLLRPILVVLGSILFFGLAIERIGLVGAVIGAVLLSGLATPTSRHGQNLVLAAGLAIFTVILFVWGLGLQLPVRPVGWGL